MVPVRAASTAAATGSAPRPSAAATTASARHAAHTKPNRIVPSQFAHPVGTNLLAALAAGA